ncbi:MAG TPA: hypothetical protein ACN46O_07885, partial [Prochlorococcus sp.]
DPDYAAIIARAHPEIAPLFPQVPHALIPDRLFFDVPSGHQNLLSVLSCVLSMPQKCLFYVPSGGYVNCADRGC